MNCTKREQQASRAKELFSEIFEGGQIRCIKLRIARLNALIDALEKVRAEDAESQQKLERNYKQQNNDSKEKTAWLR